VSSWPIDCQVGIVTPGLLRGVGRLSVAPGTIVCTPGTMTQGLGSAHPVRHEGNRVDVYVARLVPPWFNVSVPIHGKGATLIASMWLLGRWKLRRALEAAGFDVVEHVTWTDRGFRWNDMERKAG